MAKIDGILAQMKRNPNDVRFADLCKDCENFSGTLVKGQVAIEFAEPPGKVTQESICKIIEEGPRHTK
jgi:hypothetical protein